MSWRDTLFVWRGALGANGSWHGRWVGVAAADAAHADPPNEASYAAAEADGEFEAALGANAQIAGGCVAESSRYSLDGDQWHEDDTNELAVAQSIDDGGGGSGVGSRLVAASGGNEFGRFVSVGSLAGGVLCLARRYLQKRDERCAMRARDVLNAAAASGATGGEAPWRTAAELMGATVRPRKRGRGEKPALTNSSSRRARV